MADYQEYSRFRYSDVGEFNGKRVVYARSILNEITESELYEIPPEHEMRPDLISLAHYGTTQLWWIIMQYNNIDHIKDLRTGLVIRVPIIPAGLF